MTSKSSLLAVFLTLVFFVLFTQVHSLPTTQEECKCLKILPKEPVNHYNSSQLYVFGGADENNNILATASRLNSTTGKWEAINSIPTLEAMFCGAVSGKEIYLFGGFRGNVLLPDKVTRVVTADAYDCLTDTYTMLRSMPEARESCGAAALNGSIYVSGGATGSEYTPLSSVLRYDIGTDQWSFVHPMINTKRGHQLVELNGLLYAIGGYGDETVEAYNATTDQWSFVASPRFQHIFFGAAAHEGKIYVLSGSGFEVYSPNTNQWTTLNSPNDHAYEGRSLISMNGKLWAVGGKYTEDGKTATSKSVFTYDTSTAHWVKQRDMDAYRSYNTAFVVNH